MPAPNIITPDVLAEWLPEEIRSRSDLDRLLWRAERRVIGRYQVNDGAASTDVFDAFGDIDRDVELVGYAETEDGAPKPEAMDDRLLTALRDAVSRVAEHWHDSPDGHVDSVSQGERSVTYRKGAEDLPRTVFEPLRPYDDRTPYGPGL